MRAILQISYTQKSVVNSNSHNSLTQQLMQLFSSSTPSRKTTIESVVTIRLSHSSLNEDMSSGENGAGDVVDLSLIVVAVLAVTAVVSAMFVVAVYFIYRHNALK